MTILQKNLVKLKLQILLDESFSYKFFFLQY